MQNGNGIMPGMFNDTPTNNMFQSMPAQLEGYDEQKSLMDLTAINSDMKNIVIVSLIYVVISMIPIENFVYKYIAIDKVPYSNIAIKAVLAGLLFFVISHLV